MSEPGSASAGRLRFERLIAPWREDLYRFALWLSRDPELAQDVVQESMVRAWRSLDKLRDEGAVKTWLFTIVRREHARHYERKRLNTQDIDELSVTDAALIATGHDTDVDDMRQAIWRLEEDYREPLVLQVLLGFTTKEIAEFMDINPGAVLTRLHRARKKLIERMDAELASVEDV